MDLARLLGLKPKEQKEKKSSSQQFIEFCEQAAKKYPYTGKVDPEVAHALDYLEWPLDPRAVYSGARLAGLYAAAAGFFVSLMLIYVFFINAYGLDIILQDPMDLILTNYLFWFFLSLPLIFWAAGYYSVLNMPVSEAKKRFQHDLFPALRTLGYFVMSMKLVPNLEHGIKFATEHGHGVFAEKLSKILWNLQIGVLRTAEEGLDRVAYQFGHYSGEFKHALMRIRSSLLEAEDAKRYVILDSALREAKQGVKERLMDMASKLYMPSVQLFYVGVFLPLLLFILVPIGAAFSNNSVLSNPLVIFGTYDVAMPLLAFFFARYIISQRPDVYEPPEIPDDYVKNYDKIRKKAIVFAVGVALFILAMGYVFHVLFDTTVATVAQQMGRTPEEIEEILAHPDEPKYQYLYQTIVQNYDMTPYMLIYSVFIAISAALFVYFRMAYSEKQKRQKEIMQMEDEFKDAVYVLASRMGEGKPLESALTAVSENMPETRIAKLFNRIAYNVRVLGITIGDAVFSPIFGVLFRIPSKRLHTAFEVLVSAVSLGTELAAKALVVLSEQLRDEEDVLKSLRSKLGEISGMMMVMGMFVAPAVLGITIALEKVVMGSLQGLDFSQLQGPQSQEVAQQLNIQMPKISSTVHTTPQWVYLASVGVYVLEIAALLTYFSVYLLNGRDRIGLVTKLGWALLVAAVIYAVASYASILAVSAVGAL